MSGSEFIPLSLIGYANNSTYCMLGEKVKLELINGKSNIAKPPPLKFFPSNHFDPSPHPKPPIMSKYPSSIHGTLRLFIKVPITSAFWTPGMAIGAGRV